MNVDSTLTDDAALAARLRRIATSDAADALRSLGVQRVVMEGIRGQTSVSHPVAGRARTLRLLPDREDLKGPVNGPINRGLYDGLRQGDVLVVDAMGQGAIGVLGDMMFTRIEARGAAAVVVDGGVRDLPVAGTKSFPVFARGTSPGSYMGKLRPWEADVAIQCGGVLVTPRDWILADADGLLVVPDRMAPEIVQRVEAKWGADAFSQALLKAGFPLDDAYPLPAHMRQFLSAFETAGALPSHEAAARARVAD